MDSREFQTVPDLAILAADEIHEKNSLRPQWHQDMPVHGLLVTDVLAVVVANA